MFFRLNDRSEQLEGVIQNVVYAATISSSCEVTCLSNSKELRTAICWYIGKLSLIWSTCKLYVNFHPSALRLHLFRFSQGFLKSLFQESVAQQSHFLKIKLKTVFKNKKKKKNKKLKGNEFKTNFEWLIDSFNLLIRLFCNVHCVI